MKSNLKNNWRTCSDKILMIDNGGYEIKYSTGGINSENKILQNCKFYEKSFNFENTYYIENINEYDITKLSNIKKNYTRTLSRGFLFDIDAQIDIWEQIISNEYNKDKFDASDAMMMFTHSPLIPENNLEYFFQIIFEYFGFNATVKSLPHLFTAINERETNHAISPTLQLVVDSGFSSTTIVPIFKNRPIIHAMRRIDVGGKLMTNFLKESLNNLIDLDLRKDFFLLNLMKEEKCITSLDFKTDITEMQKKKINKNIDNIVTKDSFILPEYRNKTEEALKKISSEKWEIKINSLKYIIPELLYNPNLIGFEEGGLPEGIYQSINTCHSDYKNIFLENIILNGGNTKLINFKQRLLNELESIFEIDSKIKLTEPKDGSFSVLNGMKKFAEDKEVLEDIAIYKTDYEELGPNVLWKTSY